MLTDFVEKLKEKLEAELSLINIKGEDRLLQIESAYQWSENILEELNEFILEYSFENEEEEIRFFKSIKPQFQSVSIFYAELFILESNRPIAGKAAQREYFLEEQNSLKAFMDRHRALHNYYLLDKTHFDQIYFLRKSKSDINLPHAYYSAIDNRCCTVTSVQLSTIKAVLRINEYIQEMIHELDGIKSEEAKRSYLKWTGQKVQLVELIYALKVSGVFNHGQAELKEVARALEQLVGGKTGDIYRVFQEIRLRKKGRTLFLDTLKEKLEGYMEEADGM